MKELTRWKIQGLPRLWAAANLKSMARINTLVAPRVSAAVWGLGWNRWCTARRFQRNGPCLLGCLDNCDSAEHYVGCKVARQAGWKMLKLPSDNDYEQRKVLWLGATDKTCDEEKTCWHLLVYSVFMITNRRRKSQDTRGALEELKQWCRRGVEGHLASGKVLGGRWSQRRSCDW